VKPASFVYHRPDSLDQALGLLAEHGPDAKPLAGGQSLVPAMNFRLARPGALIDLNRITSLAGIEPTNGGGLRIGAMTRQRAVERSALVAERAPLLTRAMPWIAHPQIRNRGTIGGSLAHADPSAELPAVMLALDGRFVASGPRGSRELAARNFFTGILTTALAEDEILTAVEIPSRPAGSRSAFIEVARRHGDYAMAGVAVELALDDRRRCRSCRIALFSVGDTAVLAEAAMDVLSGTELTDGAIRGAAETAVRDLDPPADLHASAEYRRHLARVLVGRALRRAAA
jgi:carbon-monoxide dehydrogenase medium subunit